MGKNSTCSHSTEIEGKCSLATTGLPQSPLMRKKVKRQIIKVQLVSFPTLLTEKFFVGVGMWKTRLVKK